MYMKITDLRVTPSYSKDQQYNQILHQITQDAINTIFRHLMYNNTYSPMSYAMFLA